MSEKYEKRIIDKSRNTEEWSEFLQSAWDHLDQQTQARLEGFGGGKKLWKYDDRYARRRSKNIY